MLRLLAIGFTWLLMSIPAMAQQAKEVKAVKGRGVGLINLVNMSADCKLAPIRVPVITEPPKHGSIQMLVVNAKMAASGSCQARTAPVITLAFVPQPDFVGEDTTKIEYTDDNKTTIWAYHITVQEGGSGEKL